MDNLKSTAYPYRSNALEGGHTDTGFTKLELAALMMAQGYIANPSLEIGAAQISEFSVKVAKAVLEESNK